MIPSTIARRALQVHPLLAGGAGVQAGYRPPMQTLISLPIIACISCTGLPGGKTDKTDTADTASDVSGIVVLTMTYLTEVDAPAPYSGWWAEAGTKKPSKVMARCGGIGMVSPVYDYPLHYSDGTTEVWLRVDAAEGEGPCTAWAWMGS